MKFRRSIRIMLVLTLAIALIIPNTVKTSAASKATISKDKAILEVDAKLKLTVKDASSKVKWSTSDKTVATVSKGTVTAKSEGVATITAKTGKLSLTCTVVVIDNNKKNVVGLADSKVSEFSVFTADGGYFVTKLSKLNITFKLDTATTGAELLITDAIDDVVLDYTFGTIKAGKDAAYTWNGKCEDGSYATPGTYFITLKAGSVVNDLGSFTIQNDKDFAGGNGSEENPFKVETVEQLKKISKYADAWFVQTKDIDCDYEPVQNLFSSNQPSNGSYNGNGYKIKNSYNSCSIFGYIGKNGSLKNVKTVNATVNGNESVLCNTNDGIITECEIDGTVSGPYAGNTGFVAAINNGTVSKCSATGTIKLEYLFSTPNDPLISCGFIYANNNGGKILDCHSSVNVSCSTTRQNKTFSIGLIGVNLGMIISSYFDGSLDVGDCGGCQYSLAYENYGTLQGCYYAGNDSYKDVANQRGVIK